MRTIENKNYDHQSEMTDKLDEMRTRIENHESDRKVNNLRHENVMYDMRMFKEEMAGLKDQLRR